MSPSEKLSYIYIINVDITIIKPVKDTICTGHATYKLGMTRIWDHFESQLSPSQFINTKNW